MEVKQYMSKKVKTCEDNDSVAFATKKMAEFNIGSIIVIKDGKPIGIFTERDLVRRVVALDKNPANVLIGEVMTKKLITIDAEESVGVAYHIFTELNVRHAPVVKNNELVGIISQKDLAKVLDSQFYGTYLGKNRYAPKDLSGKYQAKSKMIFFSKKLFTKT